MALSSPGLRGFLQHQTCCCSVAKWQPAMRNRGWAGISCLCSEDPPKQDHKTPSANTARGEPGEALGLGQSELGQVKSGLQPTPASWHSVAATLTKIAGCQHYALACCARDLERRGLTIYLLPWSLASFERTKQEHRPKQRLSSWVLQAAAGQAWLCPACKSHFRVLHPLCSVLKARNKLLEPCNSDHSASLNTHIRSSVNKLYLLLS